MFWACKNKIFNSIQLLQVSTTGLVNILSTRHFTFVPFRVLCPSWKPKQKTGKQTNWTHQKFVLKTKIFFLAELVHLQQIWAEFWARGHLGIMPAPKNVSIFIKLELANCAKSFMTIKNKWRMIWWFTIK